MSGIHIDPSSVEYNFIAASWLVTVVIARQLNSHK
jgi:hypothetical protein